MCLFSLLSAFQPELIKEAKIMMPLSHKHIVRMIGKCVYDFFYNRLRNDEVEIEGICR